MAAGVKIETKKIEEALKEAMGNVSAAARKLGVNRSTLSTRVNKEKALRQILVDARESMIDNAVSSLNRAIIKGEGWAVCFFLKTQARNRGYCERWEEEKLRARLTELENHVYNQGRSGAGGKLDEADAGGKEVFPDPPA